MFDPIEFENDKLLVHGFRPQDVQGLENIAADLFDILSDENTLKFLPQKRMSSEGEVLQMLRSNILTFYAGKNYLHFIKAKSTGRVIGVIDLITPQMAREHYKLAGRYPYFIEFYLKSTKGRQGIMSELLPPIIDTLRRRRINNIAAIVNRRNIPAQKVLEKTGFKYLSKFDNFQDYYMTLSK